VNKILVAALSFSFFAVPVLAEDAPAATAAAAVATKGKMLVAVDGARLAPVYRVASDGPQIILDGRLVTVPGNTLSMVDGKLTTSLTKGQIIALP
jgi:hypothetical protein